MPLVSRKSTRLIEEGHREGPGLYYPEQGPRTWFKQGPAQESELYSRGQGLIQKGQRGPGLYSQEKDQDYV